MAGRPAAELLADLEPLGVRLGLETFRRLLAVLGAPERATPAILVAGTNGKGSVAAMLESIGRTARLRTGLYTSPHLADYRERIRLDGEEVDDATLGATLERVLRAANHAGLPPPTVFEALTATAFLQFATAGLDLAILEVGLGGRLDATNAAEPVLSVVTRVGLDHRAELGESLAAIASEKAGILRPGVPAVFAEQLAEAEAALVLRARELGTPFHSVAAETSIEIAEWRGLDGHRLRLRTPRARHEFDLHLAGEHQLENAATAVRAAEILAGSLPAIDGEAIASGVAYTVWPGRLESLAMGATGTTVLLDAAHNPDGCRALARFLARLGRPYDLLFGCLADKDSAHMLPPLAERADRVVLTRPTSKRAAHASELESLAPPLGPVVVEEARAAFDVALSTRPELLVVAGSIYLVAEVRREAMARGARRAAT